MVKRRDVAVKSLPTDDHKRKRKNPNPKSNNERKALQKIRKANNRQLDIPLASFVRIVREILSKYSAGQYRIQRGALDALHLSAECYLINLFEDMNILTVHARRKTLMHNDFLTLMRLRRNAGDQVMIDYSLKK